MHNYLKLADKPSGFSLDISRQFVKSNLRYFNFFLDLKTSNSNNSPD